MSLPGLDTDPNSNMMAKIVERMPLNKLKAIHVYTILWIIIVGLMILVYPRATGNELHIYIFPIYLLFSMLIATFFIGVDYCRKSR